MGDRDQHRAVRKEERQRRHAAQRRLRRRKPARRLGSSFDEFEDDEFTCWCGVTGKFSEMCQPVDDVECGGLGELHCYCGGDFCVCHNHGAVQCDGCADCEGDREDYSAYGDDDYDDDFFVPPDFDQAVQP